VGELSYLSTSQHETSYPYFYQASSTTTTTEKSGRKIQDYDWLQMATKQSISVAKEALLGKSRRRVEGHDHA
jgi:hypothetical protein